MSDAGSGPQTDDEFRFLRSDAERVGRGGSLPPVARASDVLADRRTVSGLAFDGEQPPQLVALHGAGLNAHSFDPALLALGRPALALDLPGHGRSDWRGDADYRPAVLAADVAAVLDARVTDPVALVGHSLGGLTAALVAAARPHLVRRVILIDITPGVSPRRDAGAVHEFIRGQRHFGSIDEIVERARRFGIGRDQAALARGIALNTRVRADGRLEWAHHFAHLDAPPGGDEPHPYAAIWRALAESSRAGVPSALIAADAGMLDAELVGEWRERLPGSPVVTIAGPHNLHEAAPAALADAIDRLLADDRAPAR
ncbi:alpha/beta fold hydrolase [Leucobacter chromiiresistens]